MCKTRERRLQLALVSGASPRTVDRWLKGKRVTAVVDYALQKAAQELGMKGNPEQPVETAQCSR